MSGRELSGSAKAEEQYFIKASKFNNDSSFAATHGTSLFAAQAGLGPARAQELAGIGDGGLPRGGMNLGSQLSRITGLNTHVMPKIHIPAMVSTFLDPVYSKQLLAINRIASVSTSSVMTSYVGRKVLYKDVTLNLVIKKNLKAKESMTSAAYLGGHQDGSVTHRIMVVQILKPETGEAVAPGDFLSTSGLGWVYAHYRPETSENYRIWLDKHFDFCDQTMSFTLPNLTSLALIGQKSRSMAPNIYLQLNQTVKYSSLDSSTSAPDNVLKNLFYVFIFSDYSNTVTPLNFLNKTYMQLQEVSQFYDV